MARAIGLVELTTVSTGFKAADDMSKAADIEILQAEVTCPGKFVVLIAGDLSAVRASVDSVKGRYGDKVIDTFVLGNPHDSIFPVISLHIGDFIFPDRGSRPEPHGFRAPPGIDPDTGKQKTARYCNHKPYNLLHSDSSIASANT